MNNEKYFRITIEIGANKESNVLDIAGWLSDLIQEHAMDVGHVSITEVTELLAEKDIINPFLDEEA